jgi:glutamyl/glutaminyl-tRNA synthetase
LGKSAFSEIAFYHHPLLKSSEGEKLSKSAGATSVQYLRQQGFKSEDIYQSIASVAGIKNKVANYEQLAEQLIAL